ncbi:MAG: aminotransferase class IV [Verrucomicrobiota bacterium]
MKQMVSIANEGFRYGRGVFETLLVQDAVALFKDWHLESIIKAAEQLSLSTPSQADLAQVSLNAQQHRGIWRWFITEDGFHTLWQNEVPPVQEAMSLGLSPLTVNAQLWEVRFKTLSYLSHIQAREQSDADECVLLNERGEIASASMANIFWIKDQKVYTPLASCGCREGVIRRWLMEKSGYEVEQGRWKHEALYKADEIFLTNSRIGIVPVTSWQDLSYPIGKLTRQLQLKYASSIENNRAFGAKH